MLGRWYVLGGVLLAMALGIVLTMLAPPYTLVKPSPHAPTGISCNYTLPIEQVNISVINYVRSYLHEKPLVWNQCLGTFAYLRYETVTDLLGIHRVLWPLLPDGQHNLILHLITKDL